MELEDMLSEHLQKCRVSSRSGDDKNACQSLCTFKNKLSSILSKSNSSALTANNDHNHRQLLHVLERPSVVVRTGAWINVNDIENIENQFSNGSDGGRLTLIESLLSMYQSTPMFTNVCVSPWNYATSLWEDTMCHILTQLFKFGLKMCRCQRQRGRIGRVSKTCYRTQHAMCYWFLKRRHKSDVLLHCKYLPIFYARSHWKSHCCANNALDTAVATVSKLIRNGHCFFRTNYANYAGSQQRLIAFHEYIQSFCTLEPPVLTKNRINSYTATYLLVPFLCFTEMYRQTKQHMVEELMSMSESSSLLLLSSSVCEAIIGVIVDYCITNVLEHYQSVDTPQLMHQCFHDLPRMPPTTSYKFSHEWFDYLMTNVIQKSQTKVCAIMADKYYLNYVRWNERLLLYCTKPYFVTLLKMYMVKQKPLPNTSIAEFFVQNLCNDNNRNLEALFFDDALNNYYKINHVLCKGKLFARIVSNTALVQNENGKQLLVVLDMVYKALNIMYHNHDHDDHKNNNSTTDIDSNQNHQTKRHQKVTKAMMRTLFWKSNFNNNPESILTMKAVAQKFIFIDRYPLFKMWKEFFHAKISSVVLV